MAARKAVRSRVPAPFLLLLAAMVVVLLRYAAKLGGARTASFVGLAPAASSPPSLVNTAAARGRGSLLARAASAAKSEPKGVFESAAKFAQDSVGVKVIVLAEVVKILSNALEPGVMESVLDTLDVMDALEMIETGEVLGAGIAFGEGITKVKLDLTDGGEKEVELGEMFWEKK